MTSQKILVIDDDVHFVSSVKYALQKMGFEVLAAYDGQKGLRQLYEHQPDLVLLDVMMPDMDGWTVCQRIREVSDVPVIMVSGKGREGDIVWGLGLGADDYMVKPIVLPVLLAKVRACLRRAEQTRVLSRQIALVEVT